MLMFTQGKSRSYESLMREIPGNNRNSGNSKYISPQFKYQYEDFVCEFCLHYKACIFRLCPYIMDNLDDLMDDTAFVNAIENANACKTKHKRTLIYLKTEARTE